MVAVPCLAVGLIMKLVALLFVLSALVLILIVLIQKGRGGGLSAAFGGGGAGGILGSKTGDFLTWVTIVAACVFLLMAVIMGKYYRPSDTGFSVMDPNSQNLDDNTDSALPSDQVDANTAAGVDESLVDEVNETAATSPVMDAELPSDANQ